MIGVTVTEQVADGTVAVCNVQDPPGVKVTMPVGMVAPVAEVSVTVAVHVDDWPTTTLDGLQDMVVVAEWTVGGVTVMLKGVAVLLAR